MVKAILLGYKKDFPKDTTTTKGDETSVTANVLVYVADAVQDHYNITEAPAAAQTAVVRQVIKTYTYKRYTDFSDTTGTDVTVPEYERSPGKSNSRGRVVILPHATAKTSKGKARTCSIRFPSFFNLIMIEQAIGSMLKANQPNSWQLLGGGSYPFVANTLTAPRTGYSCGAWLATALATPTNTDETQAVGDVTVVKTKGRKKAAAGSP